MRAEAIESNLTFSLGEVQLNAAKGDNKYLREFDLLANTGGLTFIEGFDEPVVFDLETLWMTEGEQTPMLRDHDLSRPVGHADNVQVTATNITGKGITSVPGEERQKIVDAADNGFKWQLSVGGVGRVENVTFIEPGQTLNVNGQALQGPFYFVKHYHLREISFLALGADGGGAHATLLAALKQGIASMNFAQWLADLGLNINALTPEQLSIQRGAYDAWRAQQPSVATTPEAAPAAPAAPAPVQQPAATQPVATQPSPSPSPTPAPVAQTPAPPASTPPPQTVLPTVPAGTHAGGGATNSDTLARQADAIERADQMQTLNAQFGNPRIEIDGREIPLLAHATRNNWTPGDFEVHCLRQERPNLLNTHTGGGDGANTIDMNAALVGGMLLRAGIDIGRDFTQNSTGGAMPEGGMYLNAAFRADVNSESRQRWMERAHRFANYSMVDLVIEAGLTGGLNLRDLGHYRGNSRWMRAAFSSLEISDMFTQSITAVLLTSYAEQNNTLFPMVRRRGVPNFLQNERKRMELNGNDFELHLPTQTAPDMVMSSTGESYAIKRYSKMLTINEETLIDERFDVIEDAPADMGMAAARVDPELILSVIFNNPVMKDGSAWLNATAGNLRTGKPFNRDNLKEATTAFELQQENGVTLNLSPNGLLHGKAATWDVAEILSASQIRQDAATSNQTVQNVLANLLTPVSDARFDNGFKDPSDRRVSIAGEPLSWALFTTQYPSIELGHLQGTNGMLQVDSGQLTQGQWGLWFAGKKDAGAAPMRRNTFQKNEA